MEDFGGWYRLLDLEAAELKEGKEEFSEWLAQMRQTASELWRRRRKILEEV